MERFITKAKRWSKERGWEWLDTPIFVRWCERHSRYEWCDPFSERGGVAPDKETLQSSIVEIYRCPNCGGLHVYEAAIISDDKIIKVVDLIHLVDELE